MLAEQGGGGLKGCTYVLTFGIASFHPIAKDMPTKESENDRPAKLS